MKNLVGASNERDKQYFRRIHLSVVVATYVLVLASTIIWFYSTFLYQPLKPIKGEVAGLSSPVELPEGGLVRAYHQIAPERVGDLDFYPVDGVPSLDGTYRFRWVLLAREQLQQVAFRFAQQLRNAG